MIRPCVLEIENSESYNKLYDDLCYDYKKYFPLIRSWLPIGYGTINEKDEIVYTTPEEVRQNLLDKYGKEDLESIDQFVKYILATKASSAYGIFYVQYEPSGSKTSEYGTKILFDTLIEQGIDCAIEQSEKSCLKPFLSKIRESDELVNLIEKINLSKKEILEKTNNLEGKKKIDLQKSIYSKFWKEHIKPHVDKENFDIRKIKSVLKKSGEEYYVTYPDDCMYCKILMFVICDGLSSDYEKYVDHVKNRKEEFTEIQKNQLDPNYLLLKKLDAAMCEMNLSTRFSFKEECKKDPLYKNCLSFNEEFSSLHILNKRSLSFLFKKLKREKKYCKNREYPVRNISISNPKFLFADRGSFNISSNENGSIAFDLLKRGQENCRKSFQMNNVSVEKKKDQTGFDIVYTNKLKKFTKVGNKRRCVNASLSEPISTVCKAVGLHRRKEKLTLTIFNNHEESANLKLGLFFQTADPSSKKWYKNLVIPNTINFASFDLGIVDPISFAKFEHKAGEHGQYEIPDIGYANLTESGYLSKSTEMSNKIKSLRDDIFLCKDFANRFKNKVHDEEFIGNNGRSSKKLIEDTFNKLNKKGQDFVVRKREEKADPSFFLLQETVAMLGRKLRKMHAQIRNTGYKEISEMIRIKECQDAFNSLNSVLRNLFNKGVNKNAARKFNFKRVNFNILIGRRIAAKICEYCLTNNINVAFFENLNGVQEDGKNNSIARIFSPRIIIDCIKLKLEEKGIGFAEVDKKGTSLIDNETGLIGYRDNKNHKKLHCWRGGEIVAIDADINAAINIGIKGMQRSLIPYKFYIKGDKINDQIEEQEEEYGVRMKKFFFDKYGVSKVDFYDDKGEPKPAVGKKLAKQEKILGRYLYFRNGKYLYQEQHFAEIDRIQTIVEQQVAEQNLIDSVHDFMQSKAA